MKLADTNQISSESSMELEGYAMGIDAENFSHIIDMLINQYTNLELAVLREYAANALDAHRMADQTKPIRVTLPNAFNPTLTVEDWGIGMSADDIRRIYSQYGASTKRNTNKQIGGFGIGAKSAFAVATQFTVSAVKDGVRTTVIFNRTAEGGGVQQLPQQQTDEPNGVKVTIPIKGGFTAYEDEARNLFRYWMPGEVEVVGCEIDWLLTSADSIDKHLTAYSAPSQTSPYGSRHNYRQGGYIHVRMGGIAYELTHENQRYVLGDAESNLAYKLRQAQTNLIIDVEIGSVNLAPSREALVMDAKSQKSLRPVLVAAEKKIARHYGREIESQPTMVDAVRTFLSADSIIKTFCPDPKWRGTDVPTKPEIDYLGLSTSQRGAVKIDNDDHKVNWTKASGQNVVIVAVDVKGADFTDLDGHVDSTDYALHHARRGPVRRLAKPFEEAINGEKIKGSKLVYTRDETQLALVTAADAANDPFVQAVGFATMTLAEYQTIAATYRAKRAASGDKTAWQVRYEDEVGVSHSVEELTEYDAVYVRKPDDGFSQNVYRNALAFLRAEQMDDDNCIVIQLNRRQNREVFERRMKEAAITVKVFETWYEKATAKAVKDFTDAEAQYLEMKESHRLRSVYDRVIAPWGKLDFDGLLNCTAAGEDMAAIHQNMASLTPDAIRRVDSIMAVAHYNSAAKRPEPKVKLQPLLASVPLLPVIAAGMSYSKLEALLPSLAAAIHDAEGWTQPAAFAQAQAA